MRQTHMSLNRSLLFIVIVTPEMGHLLDLYKAQQQLLETTGATLSDEGSYPPVKPEFCSLPIPNYPFTSRCPSPLENENASPSIG